MSNAATQERDAKDELKDRLDELEELIADTDGEEKQVFENVYTNLTAELEGQS